MSESEVFLLTCGAHLSFYNLKYLNLKQSVRQGKVTNKWNSWCSGVCLVPGPQESPGTRNAQVILSQHADEYKAVWVLFSGIAFSLFISVGIQMGNLGNFTRDRQSHSSRITAPTGPCSGTSWGVCKGLLRAVMCELCLLPLHLWNSLTSCVCNPPDLYRQVAAYVLVPVK